MRQFGAWVWVALTSILVLVIIVWIVQWVLSKTNVWKDKISFSRKERISRKQIKKELEEKKETIINPNTEDESTDEEFQEVIETAVAEKNEEEKINSENDFDEIKKESTKKDEENKDEDTGDAPESSIFDETTSLDTPSEKVLNDKEKKLIDRITLDSVALKNE
ncbi:hypothetical protein IJL65_05115 [bacterium]|nr:hypothetical protein [bacterium]